MKKITIMNLKSLLVCLLMMISIISTAQTVVTIGTYGFNLSGFGPIDQRNAAAGGATALYGRYANLYTAAQMAAVPCGAVITKIEYLRTAGSAISGCTQNLYMASWPNPTIPATAWATITGTSINVFSSTNRAYPVGGAGVWDAYVLTTPYTYTGGNFLVSSEFTRSAPIPAVSAAYGGAFPVANQMIGGDYSGGQPATLPVPGSGTQLQIRLTYSAPNPTDLSIISMSGVPIQLPAFDCFGPNQTVNVTIKNSGSSPVTFSAGNPLTVTTQVTGAVTQTLTSTITSGSLAACGGSMVITQSTTLNMSLNGTYTFNNSISYTGDAVSSNNTLAPITTQVARVAGPYPYTWTFQSIAPYPFYVNSNVNAQQWGGILSGSFNILNNVGANVLCNPNPPDDGVERIQMSSNTAGTFSRFILPCFNLNPMLNPQFKMSMLTDGYRSGLDYLDVLASTDGGNTWTNLTPAHLYRYDLSLGLAYAWKDVAVSLGAYAGGTVRLAVMATGVGITGNTLAMSNFQVSDNTPCSGTPSCGTITAPTTACSGVPFNVSAAGVTTGSGLTYQWQSQTACSGAWTNVGASTTGYADLAATLGGTSMAYTLNISCVNSGGVTPPPPTSSSACVTLQSPGLCYCASSASTSVGDDIGRVQIGAINNPASVPSPLTTNPSAANLYTDFTALPAQFFVQGSSYSVDITQINSAGYTPCWLEVYIDYNHSGTFDEPSEVAFSSGPVIGAPLAPTFSGSLTIPGTALTGVTGMRVVLRNGGDATTTVPCGFYPIGETEDYRINIQATLPCSGTPATGGNTVATPNPVCSFDQISLTTDGALATGSLISFQWQYNNGAGWNPISGQTNATGTATGQTVATQYRLFTTCGNGGGTSNSTATTVTQKGTLSCYCKPVSSASTGDYVSSVTLTGVSNTLSHATGGLDTVAAPGWKHVFPATGANTTTLDWYDTYTITIQVGVGAASYPLDGNAVAAWIDFDGDGIFQAGEKLGQSLFLNNGDFANFTFTVPNTLANAQTILRVRESYNGGTAFPGDAIANIDACATMAYGETEDYIVTINQVLDCSGAVTGGTTASSVASSCDNLDFTLSVTGGTTGVAQLNYQWQYGPSATGPWTNPAVGGTSATFFTNQTGTAGYFWHRLITCTISGSTSESAPLFIGNTTNCFCIPTYATGTGSGVYISRVKIELGVLDNSGLPAASPSPYYKYFTSAAGSVQQDGYYWVDVWPGTATGKVVYGIWADWNRDGDFLDANETITNNTYGIGGVANPVHVLMYVPAGASLGQARFRVRIHEYSGSLPVTSDCGVGIAGSSQGETEDYDLFVGAPTCFAVTQSGTIVSTTPNNTTVNDAVLFDLQGNVGTVYQWSYSFDNTTYTPYLPTPYSESIVQNINTPTGVIYWKATVKNQGGCLSEVSNAVVVGLNCAAPITYCTADGDFITNVSIGTGGALLNHPSTFDATLDGYQNFMNLPAVHLSKGVQYDINISTALSPGWPEGVMVWLDINGDGQVSNGEDIFNAAAATGSHAGQFTVPCFAATGLAKLRVMCIYNTIPASDPCNDINLNHRDTYAWGEIEEYMMYIDPLPELTVNPISAVCVNAGQAITASGSSTTYSWAPSNGISATTGATVTLTVIPYLQQYTITGTQAVTNCPLYGYFTAATNPLGGTIAPIGSVICSNGTQVLNSTGAAGASYQWQSSVSPFTTWVDCTGPGNNSGTSYTTLPATVTTKYRLKSLSTTCYDISSTMATVEVSTSPVFQTTVVTATSATVSWTPVGSAIAPFNFNISWSGAAGTGSATGVYSPYIINGLNPGSALNVIVTQSNPGSCVQSSSTTATTLCASPGAWATFPATPSVSGATATSITVNLPAGSWRVWYKQVGISNTFVNPGGISTGTYTISLPSYPGAVLAIYLEGTSCSPTLGQLGPQLITNLLQVPANTCAIPTKPALATANVDVTSPCPNQILVDCQGSPTGNYAITFRKIAPTFAAPVTYQKTGNGQFTYTIGALTTNQTYEVYVRSNCGGGSYSNPTPVITVVIKPGCEKVTNLLLSAATCTGFTATWNPAVCVNQSFSGLYAVYYKVLPSGALYNVGSVPNVKVFSQFPSNTQVQVFVRARSCTNSWGQASDPEQISTLPTLGCRMEEDALESEDAIEAQVVSNEDGSMNLFPNPNAGQYTIYLETKDNTTQDVRIEVMNMLGQVTLTQVTSITDGRLMEDVSMPSNTISGNYMVRVLVGDKAVFTTRVNISK